MKRTIVALFVVTVLVAGAAFGGARWLRCRSCGPASVNLHDVAALQRTLALTDAQAGELTKLEAEFQKRFAAICDAH